MFVVLCVDFFRNRRSSINEALGDAALLSHLHLWSASLWRSCNLLGACLISFFFKMCGGAIISDLIAAKRGRKLTKEDLWSELDTISDLLGLDSAKGGAGFNPSENRVAPKPKQVNKGEFCVSGFSGFLGLFGFIEGKRFHFFWGCRDEREYPETDWGRGEGGEEYHHSEDSEERVQRNPAAALGKMGGGDSGPSQGRESVARHLQHRRGSRQSLRRSRQANQRRQGQAQLP